MIKRRIIQSRVFWLTLVFVSAVLAGTQILRKGSNPDRLPIFHPNELNPALVDPALWNAANHKIVNFELLDEEGDTIELADVSGNVLIVDFFFTRCATICPVMTNNLIMVTESLGQMDGWYILSHSVTPEADTPEVLKAYAQRMGAEHPNWKFLTGGKKEIYRLARQSYFACYDEEAGGDGGMQDFVHTENVVLVDASGRIRGFYDGTSETAMNQLIEDALWLIEKKD